MGRPASPASRLLNGPRAAQQVALFFVCLEERHLQLAQTCLQLRALLFRRRPPPHWPINPVASEERCAGFINGGVNMPYLLGGGSGEQ